MSVWILSPRIVPFSVFCMNEWMKRMNEKAVDIDGNGQTALNNTQSVLLELSCLIECYNTLFFPFISLSLNNPQESKGINQPLHGFSRHCLLEIAAAAFQTAAEHSCWDCVTKYRNSFCIRSQLIVNNRTELFAGSHCDRSLQITEGPWWFIDLILSLALCRCM